jgi:hypothetical protein
VKLLLQPHICTLRVEKSMVDSSTHHPGRARRRGRWAAAMLALGIALSPVYGRAQAEDPLSPEERLLQVERRRQRAMIEGDAATLDALLADDLTYTHSTGVVDSKSDLIGAIESGKTRYRSIASREPQVRVYEASAIVTGPVDMELEADGKSFFARSRFTALYVLRGGTWRLAAYQSTSRPAD